MMPKLLAALDFRSNNGSHRPLIDALERVRAAEGEGRQYFSCDEVPIDGVVRPKWRDIVIEDAPDGSGRVNRINYEICILQTLRDKLRCKEVWVVGAHRFRNPDEDLPSDYAERRADCYARLGLPTDAQAFTAGIKGEMKEARSTTRWCATRPRLPSVQPTLRQSCAASPTTSSIRPIGRSLSWGRR